MTQQIEFKIKCIELAIEIELNKGYAPDSSIILKNANEIYNFITKE